MPKAWCILIEMIGILWGGIKESISILVALSIVGGASIVILYLGVWCMARLLGLSLQAVGWGLLGISVLGLVIVVVVELYRRAWRQCND